MIVPRSQRFFLIHRKMLSFSSKISGWLNISWVSARSFRHLSHEARCCSTLLFSPSSSRPFIYSLRISSVGHMRLFMIYSPFYIYRQIFQSKTFTDLKKYQYFHQNIGLVPRADYVFPGGSTSKPYSGVYSLFRRYPGAFYFHRYLTLKQAVV